MDHYIHNINPVILELWGPFAVRWYGVAYLLAFGACLLMLKRWARRGEFDVPEPEVGNFILALAIFGVLIGGRIGYILLYDLGHVVADPISAVRFWEGGISGMSSHGGFAGAILLTLWYARKHGYSFWNLIDNLAVTVSLGFGFGRLANFVNGELWGRATDVRWAVLFPQEARLQYGQWDPPMIEALVEAGQIVPRHPSQLYQALAEGFLVFGLMLLIRRTAWGKRAGALSASYLFLYAVARVGMELFREPDNGEFFIAGITRGQFYSLAMILGAGIIAWKKNLFGGTTSVSS